MPVYKVNVFYWDCNDFDMLLPAYIVSVFYWDKLGSSENRRLILEVVYINSVSGRVAKLAYSVMHRYLPL